MSEQSILKYFEDDHDRLDTLFQQFRRLKNSSPENAAVSFIEFKSGLFRHIRWEEDILFPLFEQKTGVRGSGPTAVMRSEHTLIKKYLETITQKFSSKDIATDEDERILVNTLLIHNQKEEQILYPAIDRLIDQRDRDEVFTKMKTIF